MRTKRDLTRDGKFGKILCVTLNRFLGRGDSTFVALFLQVNIMIEKSEFLSVRVKPEWMTAIDQAATEVQKSRSGFIRSILEGTINLPTEAEPPKQSAVEMK